MPIPTYDALMLPVLNLASQHDWTMKDLIERISTDLNLSSEERAEQIPSGGGSLIASRVHWAKTYLKQAGLLTQPKRGVVRITDRGKAVLASDAQKIDQHFLQQFDEFRRFFQGKKSDHRRAQLVQSFIGALVGQGAQKGVLITTSSFSKPAIATAQQLGNLRLVLIDGDEFTRLLVRFGVGVRIAKTVEIKRIDIDYFEDGELE